MPALRAAREPAALPRSPSAPPSGGPASYGRQVSRRVHGAGGCGAGGCGPARAGCGWLCSTTHIGRTAEKGWRPPKGPDGRRASPERVVKSRNARRPAAAVAGSGTLRDHPRTQGNRLRPRASAQRATSFRGAAGTEYYSAALAQISVQIDRTRSADRRLVTPARDRRTVETQRPGNFPVRIDPGRCCQPYPRRRRKLRAEVSMHAVAEDRLAPDRMCVMTQSRSGGRWQSLDGRRGAHDDGAVIPRQAPRHGAASSGCSTRSTPARC
jgi:hypothetical protein